MDLYIYVQEDGSIVGFSQFQPAGHNYPKVNIDDDDVQDFRANFFKYRFENGKLIKPENADGQNGDFQKQLQIEQQINAQTIQMVSVYGARIDELEKQLDDSKKVNTIPNDNSQSTSDSNSVTSESQSQSVSESVSTSQSNSNSESGVSK